VPLELNKRIPLRRDISNSKLQNLIEAILIAITKACVIRDVSIVASLKWKNI